MSELSDKAKAVALKHAKAMAIELVEEVVLEALKAAALKSENKIDDMAIAALGEPLKASLKEALEKL